MGSSSWASVIGYVYEFFIMFFSYMLNRSDRYQWIAYSKLDNYRSSFDIGINPDFSLRVRCILTGPELSRQIRFSVFIDIYASTLYIFNL